MQLARTEVEPTELARTEVEPTEPARTEVDPTELARICHTLHLWSHLSHQCTLVMHHPCIPRKMTITPTVWVHTMVTPAI